MALAFFLIMKLNGRMRVLEIGGQGSTTQGDLSMRVFVGYAHPLETSFNGALHKQFLATNRGSKC